MVYRLNGPSWSLSAEAFFYLLFPALVPLACSATARKHPLIIGATLWAISLGTVWSAAQFVGMGAEPRWLSPDQWTLVFAYTPILRLPEFMLGVLLGVACPAGHSTLSPRAGRWLTLGSLATLAVLLANARALPQVLLGAGLLMPVFGALVVGLAVGDGTVGGFLERPSLVLLGEASYSMYILHVPIHAWLRGIDLLDGGRLFGSWAWIPLYVTVVVVVSIITLKTVEIPARALVRRWLTRRAALAMSSAGA